jgi:hypothetical protein
LPRCASCREHLADEVPRIVALHQRAADQRE